MAETGEKISEYLPHLSTFIILLVLEYWTFMSHAASIIGSGDYGPIVGIPLLVSLILIIVIAYGLISMSQKKSHYKKLVPISLVLFIIQMVLIFIEYVLIASDVV